MSTPLAKQELRVALREQRRQVAADVARAASDAACAHLLALPELAAARVVALYSAAHGELATDRVDEALRARGARIVYPRVVRGQRALDFHLVDAPAQLLRDTFGVPAPPADAPRLPVGEIDVVVLPGLVFDRAGNRIGWGKGYYDATLDAHPTIPRVGYAFDFQLLDAIPTGPGDAALDCLVTERGVTRFPARP